MSCSLPYMLVMIFVFVGRIIAIIFDLLTFVFVLPYGKLQFTLLIQCLFENCLQVFQKENGQMMFRLFMSVGLLQMQIIYIVGLFIFFVIYFVMRIIFVIIDCLILVVTFGQTKIQFQITKKLNSKLKEALEIGIFEAGTNLFGVDLYKEKVEIEKKEQEEKKKQEKTIQDKATQEKTIQDKADLYKETHRLEN
ncbi:unnamed protein product [Paramecium sonneborni]|uniref:Transmembrane protein n=1 Tax=Paramecium sonneborni TaxID=65129 RepID=A0A8S1NIL1_9CILI|nr:unnamed protein product [Paramecium sonneborni]